MKLDISCSLEVDIEVLRDPRGDRVFFRVGNRAVATVRIDAEMASIDWAVPVFVQVVEEGRILNLARGAWKQALC